MDFIADIENKMLIDKNNLDIELIRQAQTYYEIGEAAVEAKSERDCAYEEYKRKDAELAIKLRKELTDNLTKFTEASLAAMVQNHPEHISAYNSYLLTAETYERLNVAKDAFASRAHALHDLVALYQSSYFTKDVVKATKGNGSDMAYEARKRAINTRRTTTNEVKA